MYLNRRMNEFNMEHRRKQRSKIIRSVILWLVAVALIIGAIPVADRISTWMGF